MPVDFVPTLLRYRRSSLSRGVSWGVTEVVSSVRIKVSADRAWRFRLPSGGIAAAPTSGGSRVDFSAQLSMSFMPLSPARTAVMLD